MNNGFEIEDVKHVLKFSKHTCFNNFVTNCMDTRIKAIATGN